MSEKKTSIKDVYWALIIGMIFGGLGIGILVYEMTPREIEIVEVEADLSQKIALGTLHYMKNLEFDEEDATEIVIDEIKYIVVVKEIDFIGEGKWLCYNFARLES